MPAGSEHVAKLKAITVMHEYLMQVMRSLIPVGSNPREGIKPTLIYTKKCPVFPSIAVNSRTTNTVTTLTGSRLSLVNWKSQGISAIPSEYTCLKNMVTPSDHNLETVSFVNIWSIRRTVGLPHMGHWHCGAHLVRSLSPRCASRYSRCDSWSQPSLRSNWL